MSQEELIEHFKKAFPDMQPIVKKMTRYSAMVLKVELNTGRALYFTVGDKEDEWELSIYRPTH